MWGGMRRFQRQGAGEGRMCSVGRVSLVHGGHVFGRRLSDGCRRGTWERVMPAAGAGFVSWLLFEQGGGTRAGGERGRPMCAPPSGGPYGVGALGLRRGYGLLGLKPSRCRAPSRGHVRAAARVAASSGPMLYYSSDAQIPLF